MLLASTVSITEITDYWSLISESGHDDICYGWQKGFKEIVVRLAVGNNFFRTTFKFLYWENNTEKPRALWSIEHFMKSVAPIKEKKKKTVIENPIATIWYTN